MYAPWISQLSEFYFGAGVATGFLDNLLGSTPNPEYYPQRECAFISPLTFNPKEINSLGYTLGFDISPEITQVIKLIRGK